jgi:flavin-dependent dehydrogenase
MHDGRIAIIGGGPAGAMAAAMLAHAGRTVVLFDEKLAWEKPCGGGLTHKALAQYPFLRDAGTEHNLVHGCELISPAGLRLWLPLDRPIAIYSRKVLNEMLLDRARTAGAELVRARVTAVEGTPGSWRVRTSAGNTDAAYVILAAGARSSLRAQFAGALAPEDFMATFGYFIPSNGRRMQVRFVAGLHGYIWSFPRCDHLSAGVCGQISTKTTAELRLLLEEFLRDEGVEYQGAPVYGHLLPALRLATLRDGRYAGEGWAIIGDAAGFVDPITGEGLYYALRSADLLAQALLAGRPQAYDEMLRRDFLPELQTAARFANRFFGGSFMGGLVTERTVQFGLMSRHFRVLLQDLFGGSQGYRDLRRRAYFNVPKALVEAGVNALFGR